jgi:hypothetical protein
LANGSSGHAGTINDNHTRTAAHANFRRYAVRLRKGAGAIASAEVATISAKLAIGVNRDVTPNTLSVFMTFLP